MGKGKLIVICQSGGKFTSTSNGSLSYTGGDAHAIGVSNETKFDELKLEMAEMWEYDHESLTIKYFLPNNKRTLITISSDKDIQRMIDFHEDSETVDIYVMPSENPTSDVSPLPCSRSSRTTVADPVTPLDILLPVASVSEDAVPINPLTPAASDAEDVIQQKFLRSWENCITGLHQQFNNVQDFREALRKYCMAHGFTYTLKKNDCKRVSAKCKAEGCPWRIYASNVSTTPLFRIKKMNGTHTCGAGTSAANRPHASQKLVASIVKEKLRDTPNFRPREIANEIRREFGIELRYSQAWRGMETAKEELQSSFKEAYNQLPWVCEKLRETNPGSVITLVTREDLSFHRLFVALHASLYGFQNGCRPLLFLDTMTVKSKYQSELLTATALDGNDDIFPVAYAIVDVVDDNNWHWFLAELKSALSSVQPITFVADRQMGLRQYTSMIFENSYHGYCLRHLTEELKRDLRGPYTEEVVCMIVAHFYGAANAATLDGFREYIKSIKNISPEACEWILHSEPEHWANALFEGSQYANLTSDIAESFYSWVTEPPLVTIAEVIDTIRRKMMELMYTRRVNSDQWLTRLTPSFEDKLQKEILRAHSLQVLISLNRTFEVSDGLGSINEVNIDLWDCSCRAWQLNGFPCFHAVTVLQHIDKNLYDYCSKYYTTEAFRLTYSESINPVPSAGRPVYRDSLPVQVGPPPLCRKSGPPKKRRIRSKGQVKRPLHCSKCKGAGHNRATCHIYS